MANTITGAQLLDHLLVRRGVGQKIANAEIGALAAGSLTSVAHFRRGHYGGDQFRGHTTIWRPGNATGVADDYRAAGTLTVSTGVLANDANWADTTLGTEDVYLIFDNIHPLWIIDAMNQALRDCYFSTLEPLSLKPTGTLVADAGFQLSATTNYVESDADGGAATTFSKVSTANSENVYRGLRSGRVLNAATGGYIRQRFNVTPGQQVVVHAVSRLDTGTNAELVLYDVSNSALIGTAVEHSQEAWQFMRRVETIPDGCKILEVRLQGEGTTADVYWGGLFVMTQDRGRIILDTTWDQSQEIPSLAYVEMGGVSVAANVWEADASRLIEIPKDAYSFDPEPPAAHPMAVQFHDRSYLSNPIYIQGRRAYSDVDGPFTRVLTETTSCDLDLLEAATARRLLRDARVQVENQAQRLADAESDFFNIALRYPRKTPAKQRQNYSYGGWV